MDTDKDKKTENNKNIPIWQLFIVLLISFIFSYIIFSNIPKNKEPGFIPNLDILLNSDVCNNKCLHIHHWIFLLFLLILLLVLNFFLGYQWNNNYYYLIVAYIGVTLSEYLLYGNNIFNVFVKCSSKCHFKKGKK